jgi:hypothetical protein
MTPLDVLLIERACERVALDASHALDTCDIEMLAACFAEDCIFIRPSTFPRDPVIGREPLIEVVQNRDPGLVGRHVISNQRVSVLNATTAEGASMFCNFAGPREQRTALAADIHGVLRSLGEYEDVFILRDGRWQITRRVGRFVFGTKFAPARRP